MTRHLSPEEVKALANLPGFGKAQEAVRAAGFWDEHAAPDGKMRRYSVTLTAIARATGYVTVDARNKDEAEDLALELIDDPKAYARISWDFADLDDFEVDESETKIIGEATDG